jgi:uncharacterized protein (TIGR03435 family)
VSALEIVTAILNSLWQAAAVAGLVWLVLKVETVNAATRCIIWWATLAVVLFLPAAPYLGARLRPQPRVAEISYRSESAPTANPHSQAVEAGELSAIVTLPEKPGAKWPSMVVALWAVVFLYRLTRIAQSYCHLRGLKRDAALSDLPLPDVSRRAPVLVSSRIASPMAVGFLHPAVVLPEDLSRRISKDELDQIVLHEAAHLARWDDWSNLLSRVLGAVLALHPLAWWILRRIEFEREAACDDWAVARTGAVRLYAESLAHMVELRSRRGGLHRADEALASGVFGRGSRIGDRIEMLLRYEREFSPRVSLARVAFCTFVLCCLAAVASLAPRWIAFAKAPPVQQVTAPVAVALPPPPMAPLIQKKPEPQPLVVAQAAASSPKAPPIPEFEVASIRPTTFRDGNYEAGFYAGASGNQCNSGTLSISGTRVSVAYAGICDLVRIAYGIKAYQVVGAPALPPVSGMQAAYALVGEHPSFFYDIEARASGPDTPTEEQVRAMVRTLLADRFRLKLHRDTRELSYLALVVGKGGTKLTPTKEDCQPHAEKLRGGWVLKASAVHVCNQSMEQLVQVIGTRTDRPIVDKTGLTGNFDYDLHTDFTTGEDLNSVYLEAYQRELGLVLQSAKGPVDVLVVDHVEVPSEN